MTDLLIVDDEKTLLANLALQLAQSDYRCRTAESAAAALELIEHVEPQIALFDLRLPDTSGLDLIKQVRSQGRDFPIVVMTAFGSVETAVEAMKVGASDYLQKPVAIGELEVVLHRVLQHHRMRDRLDVFERERQRQGAERQIVAEDESMQRVLALAARIAAQPPDDDGHLPTVLITGETGTGKDLLAHHIHDLGPHQEEPFVQINCTALPASLAEAELFGYEQGAFTDAKSGKKGLFEVAGGGTVFLDEIGDMPLELQAKLLLVLEKREFRRVGGTRERRVQARTIAATNCNLHQLVAEGRFRKDLYFRLQSISIELPPLRARGHDLLLLTHHFLKQRAKRLHRPPPALSPRAETAIQKYTWPGNVRELDNVLQRAMLLSDSDTIDLQDLNLTQQSVDVIDWSLDTFRFPFDREACTLARVESLLLHQALDHCGGNVSEAARLLGMSRGTFRHRLEKLSQLESSDATNNA